MSRKFVVIFEAAADFATATEIADRALIEHADWLDKELLASQRAWIDKEEPGGPLAWKSVPGRARDAGIRVHGHFAGKPGLPDAHAARRAITYVLRRIGDVEAIVLVRDTDDQRERLLGLRQARSAYGWQCPIALGVAICERESWVISGFVPRDEDEAERVRSERQKLGFDPCSSSQELTAGKDDTALRSPKRVLAALTSGDEHRERECWQATPLATLRSRGQLNGLSDFLEEVRTQLVPIITGHEETPHRS